MYGRFTTARPFPQRFPQMLASMNRTTIAIVCKKIKNEENIFFCQLMLIFPIMLPLTLPGVRDQKKGNIFNATRPFPRAVPQTTACINRTVYVVL